MGLIHPSIFSRTEYICAQKVLNLLHILNNTIPPEWERKNLPGQTVLHSYFLDIVLIAQYPVFCVDCTVLGRKTWPNQLGPGQPGQHLNQGRQSMNRTSTVGQLLKGSNTSQRNIQVSGNREASFYHESTQNIILQMHILPRDFGRIWTSNQSNLGGTFENVALAMV